MIIGVDNALSSEMSGGVWQGAINASANTITLEASKNEHQETIARYESSKGFLSSSSKTNLDTFNTTGLQGTSLSAEQINLQATQDLHISASEVVATGDVNLVSTQGNVTVQSGQTTSAEYHFERIKESGLLSGSGEGITIGQSQTTTKEWINETGAQGSTIGSLEGNVNILARQGQYTQTGSDVLALQGDINVVAQDISVTEARETSRVEQRYEFKQSGLTISISSPAISVMQTAQQMSDAVDKTKGSQSHGRSQALAAGAVAMSAVNNAFTATQNQAGAGQNTITGVNTEMENNRLTIDREDIRIKELAHGDLRLEASLMAAACARIRCSEQFEEGSAPWAYYKVNRPWFTGGWLFQIKRPF